MAKHTHQISEGPSHKSGGPITVHVCPHSHDDVGWLKTPEEYYDGSRRDIYFSGVRVELTTIVDALLKDSSRKFSVVEMKYFSMWWADQTPERKDQTRKLVQTGQIEIVNAGWSMHDEACPTYEDFIANMMIGHDFALQEFGVKPRVGWQIDTFGHSNTNARFFSDMGFDALFFARLDYQDKEKRLRDMQMEYVWQPNADELKTDAQIFTHVLFHHYSSPEGFNWDILGTQDAPWENNDQTSDYNAPEEA
jgi:alpha-mannosidase